MTDDLATVWDALGAADEEADAPWMTADRRGESLILAALARAVRDTSLSRLFPFTSLSRFCLGDGADFWRAGADGGRIAPAFVVLTAEHHYQVGAGNPYRAVQFEPVLATRDPVAAARCLERLLSGWPGAA